MEKDFSPSTDKYPPKFSLPEICVHKYADITNNLISLSFRNIPKWDILFIPYWYNNVKSIFEVVVMRLYELRKQRRISQLRLALELNMNQNSISRYETGEREADYATLIRIADYFNVSIDYLLERTDNPVINR